MGLRLFQSSKVRCSVRLEPFFLLPFSAPIFLVFLFSPYSVCSVFSVHLFSHFSSILCYLFPCTSFFLLSWLNGTIYPLPFSLNHFFISFLPFSPYYLYIFSFLLFLFSNAPLLLPILHWAGWMKINSDVFSSLLPSFIVFCLFSLLFFLLFLILCSFLPSSPSLLNCWIIVSYSFLVSPPLPFNLANILLSGITLLWVGALGLGPWPFVWIEDHF